MEQNEEYKASLVGIDIETGGLSGYVELETGERVHGAAYYPILQIALVVPAIDEMGLLDIEAGHSLIVNVWQDKSALSRLNDYVLKMHTNSGLLNDIETGNGADYLANDIQDAEQYIIQWLAGVGVAKFERKAGTGAMVYGNNISFDMTFIDAQMPELARYFHYRKIDVSAINVLARTIWHGKEIPMIEKQLAHTALSDIKETTKELNEYTKGL